MKVTNSPRVTKAAAIALLTPLLAAWASPPAMSTTPSVSPSSAAVSSISSLASDPEPDLATETSNTVRNPDGSYTSRLYTSPVNYEDAGAWVPISNELVPAAGATYAVRNEANAYTVSLPEDPSTAPVKFLLDGNWVKMQMHGADEGGPEVDGAEATYQDLRGASVVTYEATDTGVKETILLDEPPVAAPTYRYTLTTSANLRPVSRAGGAVDFVNDTGETLFQIPAGVMNDSASDPAYSDDVAFSLRPNGDQWTFTVSPDFGWLTDPARVYPIFVDPTINTFTQKTCWLQEESASASHCTETNVKAGANNSFNRRRALLDFNVNALPSNAKVNSATANLYLDTSLTFGDGGATTYGMYLPGKIWGACASWTYTCANGGTWSGGGSGGLVSGNTLSLGGSGTSGWKSWDLTTMTQHWIDGWELRGVLLRQTNETTKRVLSFVSRDHSNTALRPYLQVTYTLRPNQPTSLLASPGNARTALSTTPQLSAIVSDPEGQSVVGAFTIYKDDVAIWSSFGPTLVASGARSSVTVPAGILQDHVLYRVEVAAVDETSTVSNANLVETLYIGTTGEDPRIIDPGMSTDDDDPEEHVDPADVPSPIPGVAFWALNNSSWSSRSARLSSFTDEQGRSNGWWDGQCPGPDGSDRYEHLKHYPRAEVDNRMVGDHAIMYCGMENNDNPEKKFGLRHIRDRHQDDFEQMASYEAAGRNWGNWMHWAISHTFENPYRATFVDRNGKSDRFCYERYFAFGDEYNESNGLFKIKLIVWTGETARRIMTAYPRTNPYKVQFNACPGLLVQGVVGEPAP